MELIKGHDWSYMMSDSDSVYMAGVRNENGIKDTLHTLIGIEREDAEALYNEVKAEAGPDWSDVDGDGLGLKYRVIRSWFKPYIEV